jgi:serine/threonine-protein kinase
MTAEPLVCSSCHTPLPDAAAFCHVCGTPTPTGTTADGATLTRPSLQSVDALVDTRRRLERSLGPNFQVGDLVGRGGFAEVFAVRDLRLKRDLAAKVLSPELVVNQAMLQRFKREAEAIATLRHPSIVPIYDIGEAGGIAYILMPLIRGETLRKRLDREPKFPISEVRRILAEVSGALQIAHEAGLVHRDIKPENIMLEGPRQQVLVMDFGIAKALDPEQTGMTSSGLIVGTPHYMSPEQASGDAVDGRSDQYSLAVLGYRMSTGGHPFEGENTRALLYKQVFENPPPARERNPEVPQALSDALQRAMAKDPRDRYATIDDFATAISVEDTSEYVARTQSTKAAARAMAAKAAPAPPSPARPRPASVRRYAMIGAVGSLAVVAVYAVTRLGTGAAGPTAPVGDSVPPAAAAAPPSPSAATPEPRATPPDSRTAPRTATAPVVTTKRPTTPAAPASCAEAVTGQQFSVALTLCRTEADGGSAAAGLALGGLYANGQGTGADAAEAARWYRMASDAGSLEASYRLGQMTEEGRGVAADPAAAATLYQGAARRGHAPSMRALARQLAWGTGVKRNDAEAVAWYRRAVAANDVPAMVRLGELYTMGRGVPKNETEAVRLFTRAADAGDAEGQYLLARSYLSGRGVGQSDSIGLMWLQKAAAGGNAPAREELARRTP